MTNNNTNKIEFQLTAFQLKVIAMIAMLCDHAAKTISFGFDVNWFLYIGRIAYPIFAFQLVEGYFKTKDLKKYCKRLLIFAIISEIPYNFIAGLSSIINPFSQNVLWTMLIGLLVLKIIDKILFQNLNFFIKTLGVVFIIIAGYLVATFAMVDYSGPGILTFVLFYFSRKCNYRRAVELFGLIIINIFMFHGELFLLNIGNIQLPYSLQGLAIFSLIPIWLYKGKQGYHSKTWSYFCYCFYPAHIIILVLIGYLTLT